MARPAMFLFVCVFCVSCFVFLCIIWLFFGTSTSAIDFLERLVPEITCYISSGTLNSTHSLTRTYVPVLPEVPKVYMA